MVKKSWENIIGDPNIEPEDSDSLLAQTKSDRERKRIQRQDEIELAEHETRKAELEKKRVVATTAVEKTGEEGNTGFKITGGVDMGHLDLAAERKEAHDELGRLKQEADDTARATGQENQLLRDKINEQNIKFLTLTFQAQMEQLTKMIDGNASKKSFIEQYTEALETATALGLGHPSAESSDMQTTLALKKLDFEQGIELKRLAREERSEGRRWQMELRRLDDEREVNREEQEYRRKNQELFASAPDVIGRVIASGLMQTGAGEATGAATKGKITHHVEAGMGEGGETDCPSCGEAVAIGPTARIAVCSKCNTKLSIKRVETESE